MFSGRIECTPSVGDSTREAQSDRLAGQPLTIAAQAHMTQNIFERMRGLLGSQPLRQGQALWIRPCNSVHMFFMRYALDVVYMDKQERVCQLVSHLRPWRLSACFSAVSVIELRAGDIERLGLKVGDKLTWHQS